ncbi:L-aspartate/glutamate-specific racemase [Alphaproteobacteria bacterium SO-S41]|nr:L-aspartate/glutamate-specific racemase [Alphaproteobacteria bacterium SO-S41]
MKLIGLIGGLSWESSAAYYALINRAAQQRLGGVHSARSLMASLDFGAVEKLQAAGDWDGASAMVVEAAKSLEAGGAELLVICSNTMSIASEAVAAACKTPLLHIADATAAPILAAGHRKVGLLGTAFTMEMSFLKDRLAAQGLDILIPGPEDRATVHRVIYDELIKGIIAPASREAYLGVIGRLAAAGAEAVILGCTEIGLLIDQSMTAIPLFDTMALHAIAALDRAMESEK